MGSSGESKAEDIYLLSLEGRDAIAHLKNGSSGASQLFPNTRVTSDPSTDLVTSAPQQQQQQQAVLQQSQVQQVTTAGGTSAAAATSSLISIEVDVDGNLVLHKSNLVNNQSTTPATGAITTNNATSTNIKLEDNLVVGGQVMDASGAATASSTTNSLLSSTTAGSMHHMAKVRKYHRRPREGGMEASSSSSSGGGGGGASCDNKASGGGMKKESRLLHYCPVCNKGFKVFCKFITFYGTGEIEDQVCFVGVLQWLRSI